MSYGIIQSYGGTIGYMGNPWGGATFFFDLPVEEEEMRFAPVPVASGQTAR